MLFTSLDMDGNGFYAAILKSKMAAGYQGDNKLKYIDILSITEFLCLNHVYLDTNIMIMCYLFH